MCCHVGYVVELQELEELPHDFPFRVFIEIREDVWPPIYASCFRVDADFGKVGFDVGFELVLAANRTNAQKGVVLEWVESPRFGVYESDVHTFDPAGWDLM
jgi:hypothetical protein